MLRTSWQYPALQLGVWFGTVLTEAEPADESVGLQGSTGWHQGHSPLPWDKAASPTDCPHLLPPARQEVTAPVDEGWQRGGIFSVQKDFSEKLMTTATEIRQSLMVWKLMAMQCGGERSHARCVQV